MNQREFNEILEARIAKCLKVMAGKADEYASDNDRLSNFKTAAELKHCNPAQALTGMMAKHTVSVYDMVETGDQYTLPEWEEKIGDHLNYLFLLRALILDAELVSDI